MTWSIDEIIILPKTTYILTDYTVPRRIFTDGRDWPKEMDQNFNGLSIGKWTEPGSDGRYSVLEAETRGFKGPRTFEASGIRLHDDNQTVIKERFSIDKADKNILLDEITTIDHALTRPWVVTKRYRHEPDPSPIWHFNDCAEDNHHVVLGKDSYFITSDGMLMPTRGQKPPDLRYFPPREIAVFSIADAPTESSCEAGRRGSDNASSPVRFLLLLARAPTRPSKSGCPIPERDRPRIGHSSAAGRRTSCGDWRLCCSC